MKNGQSKNITPVTVIVSAYAAAPYLHETLSSIVGQLEPEDELIVFHNGVTAWGPEINQLNGVIYTTYRTGRRLDMEQSWSQALMLGRNDWILWMHDDDLLRNGALSLLKMAVSGRPLVNYACGTFFFFLSQEKPVPEWPTEPISAVVCEIQSNENLVRYLFGPQHACSGMLLKRSMLACILPIPLGFGPTADVWLFQRLAFNGLAAFLSDVTVAYRLHSGNETNRYLSTFKGKREWRRSRARQRGDCGELIQQKGLSAEFVASFAREEPIDVVLDVVRSLIRARSNFTKPLVEAINNTYPGIYNNSGWKRIKAALVFGPWLLDVTGVLSSIINTIKSKFMRITSRPLDPST